MGNVEFRFRKEMLVPELQRGYTGNPLSAVKAAMVQHGIKVSVRSILQRSSSRTPEEEANRQQWTEPFGGLLRAEVPVHQICAPFFSTQKKISHRPMFVAAFFKLKNSARLAFFVGGGLFLNRTTD